MSEDNKSIEEIIAISYFDTDNMDIKNHVDRYFEIKRDIINILNKYNVMWVLTDTNGFNNKDKEIEKLNKELENLKELNNSNYQSFIEANNIINELEERYYSLDQNMGKSIIENDTREDFVKMEEIFIKAKRCDKE